ncbi:helix-turn-helix transcriptional regulator [Ruegeria sp. 2205SS24-7]|uniref:helix-turn-helix domain-containing protein n=1 Tax=Ruegeria discodermiae TaxID=3064389 RepID=UPI002741126A|nr:helix-turn-helix transcriptional regulator [Ruegeria sp. 2205SS24-7]MDP5216720.1 helix-turn-helix transcriptional regulator [Ruegeria sp. 2205SS24-7]
MFFCSENSDFDCMEAHAEKIDGDWIKARMDKKRGAQARIAEALGITAQAMSALMKGDRSVQSHEIPILLEYFGETLTGKQNEDFKASLVLLQEISPEKQSEARRYLQFLKDSEESGES